MNKSIAALRSVLALGLVLLVLGVGGCKSTNPPAPAPNSPGPHNGTADAKDTAVRSPGPHN